MIFKVGDYHYQNLANTTSFPKQRHLTKMIKSFKRNYRVILFYYIQLMHVSHMYIYIEKSSYN